MGICKKCGESDILTSLGYDHCQRCSMPEENMTADEALSEINDGYEMLRDEFVAAVEQASGGKGKERHANNQPFDQQPILAITRLLEGHPCAALAFQIIKKTIEAGRLVELRGIDSAVAETYGVMNYAGAMAIRLKELGEVKHG